MAQNQRDETDWIQQLKSEDAQQAEAIQALQSLLLRAALFTFSRNLTDLQHRSRDDVLALAEDCAQEALVAVLQQLETFRGESRFTTWAYKFGVHKALESARRERWRDKSIDLELDEVETREWIRTGKPEEGIDRAVQVEIWNAIQRVICEDLSERQRLVVKLIIIDEVPMDVVTERMKTNRNAVYKTLHDARKVIRRKLEALGYSTGEILELFHETASAGGTGFSEGGCL